MAPEKNEPEIINQSIKSKNQSTTESKPKSQRKPDTKPAATTYIQFNISNALKKEEEKRSAYDPDINNYASGKNT